MRRARIGWCAGVLVLPVAVIAVGLVRAPVHARAEITPEIALTIGEPYEAMRQRSSAKIPPAIDGGVAYGVPLSDARLRFMDPQYGFVTPPAKFFTVWYNHDRVDGVRMSPQIEPLLLDDALRVVLDLQDQWRKAGWKPVKVDAPPIADTPAWRERLRNENQGGTTFWQAGDRYQVMLDIHLFDDHKHPNEERYLITLALGKPWIEP